MKRVLDDLNLFCTVVEKGSLKATSKALNIPHSTVSRRIDALEENLGLHLLHRTTREVKVTPRGLDLYNDCAQLFEALNSSVDVAIDAEIKFKGSLKVSMPTRAGIDFLGNWLIDFNAEHPELDLALSLSNENINLLKEDVDLAFRVGPLVDSSAIALRLWDIPYELCATSAYVKKHGLDRSGISLDSILDLPSVVAMPTRQWMFEDENHQNLAITPNSKLKVDDLGLALHAIQTGEYLGYLPSSMISDDLAKIKVKGAKARTRTMYAFYIGKRHSQSQIKIIVDYIRQRYYS